MCNIVFKHPVAFMYLSCTIYPVLNATIFTFISPPYYMFDSDIHTQEVTTSYTGARNNIQIGTDDNTKKGLTNRSNTGTPSRNIKLYHLDKWMMPLIDMQESYTFKKF
jgi:hypothetical protein